MRSASIADLKNNLSRYLRHVRRGEEILIRDRNVPIAKIVPLDGVEAIPVCVAYRHRGKRLTKLPVDIQALAEVEPEYTTYPGWRTPVAGVRRYADLPGEARRYLESLAEMLKVRLGMVSVGSDREETIPVG